MTSMTSMIWRLNASLGLGVLLALGACGMAEPGDEPGTASESAAISADSQTCYGPFERGNPKFCLFTVQEKEQQATLTCNQLSQHYGMTLVVTNEDDHLACETWFSCCTPQ